MPEVTGGRITVPIFFYPTSMQMKKQWQTLTDPEDPRKSTELSKLQSSHQLGADTLQLSLWSDPARNAALQQLLQLGFEESASKSALQSAAFDAEQAAELLLLAGAADDLGLQQTGSSSSSSCQPSRWGKKLAKAQAASITEAQLNLEVLSFFFWHFLAPPGFGKGSGRSSRRL